MLVMHMMVLRKMYLEGLSEKDFPKSLSVIQARFGLGSLFCQFCNKVYCLSCAFSRPPDEDPFLNTHPYGPGLFNGIPTDLKPLEQEMMRKSYSVVQSIVIDDLTVRQHRELTERIQNLGKSLSEFESRRYSIKSTSTHQLAEYPKCGGSLPPYDRSQEWIFCQYCGAAFIKTQRM